MPLELKAKPHCCEEASPFSVDVYMPCNRPAAFIVQHIGRAEGPYRMCDECMDHNVRHRNASVVGPYVKGE